MPRAQWSGVVWCVMFGCVLQVGVLTGWCVYCCAVQHTIRVWDTHFGQCLAVLPGHTSSVLSLVVSCTLVDKSVDRSLSGSVPCVWSASEDGQLRGISPYTWLVCLFA